MPPLQYLMTLLPDYAYLVQAHHVKRALSHCADLDYGKVQAQYTWALLSHYVYLVQALGISELECIE